MDSPTILSIAAGGGGLDRGFRLAVPNARTVCYVEIEITAIAVLVKAMEEASLDDAPIWTDCKTFDGNPWRGVVDWVIGGYPCQPFSIAGRRAGHDDPRNLWPAIKRIIGEVRPRGCFFENVGQHLRDGYFDVVKPDLERLGYRVEETLVQAADVGAPHKRERLFILAHANAPRDTASQRGDNPIGSQDHGKRGEPQHESSRLGGDVANASRVSGEVQAAGRPDRTDGRTPAGTSRELGNARSARPQGNKSQREPHGGTTESGGAPVDDTSGRRQERLIQESTNGRDSIERTGDQLGNSGGIGRRTQSDSDSEAAGVDWAGGRIQWPPSPKSDEWANILATRPDLAPAQSSIRGMADGVAYRGDRLRILGNGVVPQQASLAFSILTERFDK